MSRIKALWEKILTGAKGRLLRSICSLAIGYLVERYKNNALYLAITPLLMYVAKLLRDKYPGTWEWLPF